MKEARLHTILDCGTPISEDGGGEVNYKASGRLLPDSNLIIDGLLSVTFRKLATKFHHLAGPSFSASCQTSQRYRIARCVASDQPLQGGCYVNKLVEADSCLEDGFLTTMSFLWSQGALPAALVHSRN